MTPYVLTLILCSSLQPTCDVQQPGYQGRTYEDFRHCDDVAQDLQRKIQAEKIEVPGHYLVLHCGAQKVHIHTVFGERRA